MLALRQSQKRTFICLFPRENKLKIELLELLLTLFLGLRMFPFYSFHFMLSLLLHFVCLFEIMIWKLWNEVDWHFFCPLTIKLVEIDSQKEWVSKWIQIQTQTHNDSAKWNFNSLTVYMFKTCHGIDFWAKFQVITNFFRAFQLKSKILQKM